jgi:hypothetical protein
VIFERRNIFLVEIYGQFVEMYGEGAMNKGNVRFSKKAGQMYVMRNEVGGQTVYVVSFQASCTVLTLQQVIITRLSTSRNFWQPTQSLRSNQETEPTVQDWLSGFGSNRFLRRHMDTDPVI